MTFLPLLDYYLLRPGADRLTQGSRTSGFGKWYSRAVGWALSRRWKVLAAFSIVLAAGGFFATHLQRQFFPRDDFYLSYVDIRLPEDAPLSETQRPSREAEDVILAAVEQYDRMHASRGHSRSVLASITSFVGAGGPR